MTLRALDIHAHFRTGERATSSEDTGVRDADKMFLSSLRAVDPAAYFREHEIMAVVFDVDNETTSGLRSSNDQIVELVQRAGGQLLGFASVDPWKGAAAIKELARSVDLGLQGLKVQPITQQFRFNDRRFYPLWDYCQATGLPILVHTGTTGIGAGTPGGKGLKLAYGRPVPEIDDVAADFPGLTLIAAHFGWPWFLEMLAVARHKGNVYIDLSGWAPRYFPSEVVQYLNSVIPDKFVYGSDFPLLSPERWLEEFEQLDIKDEVRPMILYENACRILNVTPSLFDASC